MKVAVDNKDVLVMNDIQCKVIQHEISSEEFHADMERRVGYIIQHKYEQCMKRLRDQWMPKLKGRVESIPVDDDAFAQLIFSQPDYKDRKARDLENVPEKVVIP